MPVSSRSRSLASCVAPRMLESVEYAFSDAHAVGEPRTLHVLGHLLPAAELVDERLIEPRLVDSQARIGQQPVAVEPLDVVALERAAISPDVDVVFLHRADEHRAGDGAADRRGVEVGNPCRRDVKRAALEHREPFGDELRPAVDEPRLLGAVLQRLARNLVVVGFVRLAEVCGVGVRNRAFRAHPMQRGAGIEPAGKGDADAFARRKALENVRHGIPIVVPSLRLAKGLCIGPHESGRADLEIARIVFKPDDSMRPIRSEKPASQAGKTLLRLIVLRTPRGAIEAAARCRRPPQRFNRTCRPAPTVFGSNRPHRPWFMNSSGQLFRTSAGVRPYRVRKRQTRTETLQPSLRASSLVVIVVAGLR